MITNKEQVKIDMKLFAEKMNVDLVDAVNIVALEADKRIVKRTPFETRRAMKGWVLSPATKGNPVAVISNNVEYIVPLEYGTAPYGFSKQAPRGMVRITLEELRNFIKGWRKK